MMRWVCQTAFALVFLVSASLCPTALAANIFDDDWVPPKAIPATPPHAVPSTTPTVHTPPATQGSSTGTTRPATSSPVPVAVVPTPTARLVPSPAELSKSRALLKEAFAKQLADRIPPGRRRLAQEFLKAVPESAASAADQYVLLGGAISAAREGSDLRACFTAIEQLSTCFQGIDSIATKADAVALMNGKPDSAALASENLLAVNELVDSAVDAENFVLAGRVLASARNTTAGNTEAQALIQKRQQEIEQVRSAHDHTAAQAEKLAKSPDDPAANLAVGTYSVLHARTVDGGPADARQGQ